MLGKMVSIFDDQLFGKVVAVYNDNTVDVEGEEGSIGFCMTFNMDDCTVIE
jgi:hypothetical protein